MGFNQGGDINKGGYKRGMTVQSGFFPNLEFPNTVMINDLCNSRKKSKQK